MLSKKIIHNNYKYMLSKKIIHNNNYKYMLSGATEKNKFKNKMIIMIIRNSYFMTCSFSSGADVRGWGVQAALWAHPAYLGRGWWPKPSARLVAPDLVGPSSVVWAWEGGSP